MWKRRQPDLVIGPRDAPQTLRWHLFQWRGVQVALHKWERSDSDRALHDHSADNISIILSWQGYAEVVRDNLGDYTWHRFPFWPYYRKAETPHRVVLHDDRPVWTIWIRFKPRRNWGFWCSRKRWVYWEDYVDSRDSGLVGRGCG